MSVTPDPVSDGTCPVCSAALLLVENVIVRRETPLSAVEAVEDSGETFFYPLLSGESDSVERETVASYLSCSGLTCRYVFAPEAGSGKALGEPDLSV